jgi:hypothetical protein
MNVMYIKQYVPIDIEQAMGKALDKFPHDVFASLLSDTIWHYSRTPSDLAKEIILKMEGIIREDLLNDQRDNSIGEGKI